MRNGEYACFAELEPLIVSEHDLPTSDGNVEPGLVRKLNYHANKTVAFVHLLHRNFQPFRVYDERRNEVVDRQQEANYRYGECHPIEHGDSFFDCLYNCLCK